MVKNSPSSLCLSSAPSQSLAILRNIVCLIILITRNDEFHECFLTFSFWHRCLKITISQVIILVLTCHAEADVSGMHLTGPTPSYVRCPNFGFRGPIKRSEKPSTIFVFSKSERYASLTLMSNFHIRWTETMYWWSVSNCLGSVFGLVGDSHLPKFPLSEIFCIH